MIALMHPIEREQAMIERACERALTDPRGVGVRVDRYADHIEVSVSDSVPFGEVHDHRHY